MTIAGKRYRIKSRYRFTMFIAITIVLIVMLFNTIIGLNDASSLTLQEYMTLEVNSGDTLWQIASDYMPDSMDTREAVHKICSINSTSADQLRPGQTLLIPIYN